MRLFVIVVGIRWLRWGDTGPAGCKLATAGEDRVMLLKPKLQYSVSSGVGFQVSVNTEF